MSLSRHERHLCEVVAREVAGTPPNALLEQLFEAGIINHRAVEALAIRRHIEADIRQGARTSDAITWAADEFCCSYEKARQIYYQKPSKRNV